MTQDDAPRAADALFAQARALHAAGRIADGLALARRALAADPSNVEAMEHIANVLVTRQRKYAEGLAMIDEAAKARPSDAGLWYARGWCYEFAAHESRRRPAPGMPDPMVLLEVAAESFRRCLALGPEGKLADDAADLLEHVENELS